MSMTNETCPTCGTPCRVRITLAPNAPPNDGPYYDYHYEPIVTADQVETLREALHRLLLSYTGFIVGVGRDPEDVGRLPAIVVAKELLAKPDAKAAAEWVTLDDIEPGELFETDDGDRGLVTEYLNKRGQFDIYLLGSGETGSFQGRPHTEIKVRRLEAVVARLTATEAPRDA